MFLEKLIYSQKTKTEAKMTIKDLYIFITNKTAQDILRLRCSRQSQNNACS